MTHIAIAGAGYVGLSLACLLARDHEVALVDVVPSKVGMLNRGESPIKDAEIETSLASGELRLQATLDAEAAYENAEVVFIATPTDYDEASGWFDVSCVDAAADAALAANPSAVVVVRSTVPVGYTDSLAERHPGARILFSPEFLREGKALLDNLHPSRIVVGVPEGARGWTVAERVVEMLAGAVLEPHVERFVMAAREAESVKLFANTYLAMRVAFFNELDSYAMERGMDSANIISAVAADSRIGHHYCNPSFGYGGYCLPKDSKQLLASFGDVPQELMGAVVRSNVVRKRYIADYILGMLEEVGGGAVGAYRLVMKSGSDNFRASAVQDVIRFVKEAGVEVLVYEPRLGASNFEGCPKVADLEDFKCRSAVIMANRMDGNLADVREKVCTRDILGFG